MKVLIELLIGPAWSALSLRLFGEDVTVAAREAAQQNKATAAISEPVVDKTNDAFDSAQDADEVDVPEAGLWARNNVHINDRNRPFR